MDKHHLQAKGAGDQARGAQGLKGYESSSAWGILAAKRKGGESTVGLMSGQEQLMHSAWNGHSLPSWLTEVSIKSDSEAVIDVSRRSKESVTD
jgi:hypothetical protein